MRVKFKKLNEKSKVDQVKIDEFSHKFALNSLQQRHLTEQIDAVN